MPKKRGASKIIRATEIGLAAAGLAGAYLLYGVKNAAKNRKKVRGWTLKAKGEILEKLENAKEISEGRYHEIVDTVAKKYSTLKQIDQADVAAMANEAKRHWKTIQRHLVNTPKTKAKKTKKK
jgi:hypothetical protein